MPRWSGSDYCARGIAQRLGDCRKFAHDRWYLCNSAGRLFADTRRVGPCTRDNLWKPDQWSVGYDGKGSVELEGRRQRLVVCHECVERNGGGGWQRGERWHRSSSGLDAIIV